MIRVGTMVISTRQLSFMIKGNEAIARHRNQLSNGKQPLGVLGSFLLLLPFAL